MIFTLLPIFLLTGGLFGVAAFFSGAFVFELSVRQLRRLSLLFVGLFLILPPAYFQVYMLAKPKDPSDAPVTPDAAAVPAVWLAVLLAAVALGLWRASARKARNS